MMVSLEKVLYKLLNEIVYTKKCVYIEHGHVPISLLQCIYELGTWDAW